MSHAQMLRPWVATTQSPAVGGWANSWTATVVRPMPSFDQLLPRLALTNAPNSVPQYSMFGFVMSSRRQRVLPNAGRLDVMFSHVFPWSLVTNTYGLSSSDRWA